jgi:hypothetical protein
VSRMRELRARRAVLLARCAEQRADLARRIAELRRGAVGGGDGAEAAARGGARHPLSWIVVLGGLMLVTRAREVLSLLLFMRSAVALAARGLQLLRLVGLRTAGRSAGGAATSPAAPAESRPGTLSPGAASQREV